MTFSIGMRAPSQAELIVDLAEELAATLVEECRYADPDLQVAQDPHEIDAASLARVDAAVARLQSVDPAQRREWFGRFITRYRASGDISAGPRVPRFASVMKTLQSGGSLLRHPFSRMAWARAESTRSWLFANGESIALSADSARLLAASESIDAAILAQLDESGRKALESLLAGGHYQLQRQPKKQP